MNNFWVKRLIFTGFSILALTMTACSPEIEEEVTPDISSAAPTEPQPQPDEPVSLPPESTEYVTTPHSPDEVIPQSDDFYLGQYYNDNWAIAIVEGSQGYTYYGCSQGEASRCITLTDGNNRSCGGDVCSYVWTTGNLTYQADVSEMRTQVFVMEGNKIIVDTDQLTSFYPGDDQIPADREDVTGISEEQLKTIADQIYRAVYAEDWGAIASLSSEVINLNYPDEEITSEIGRQDISAALNNADLEEWKARIMTSRLDDLLLNQYGAMFGGGSLWVSEIVGEPEPKIYSINIW